MLSLIKFLITPIFLIYCFILIGAIGKYFKYKYANHYLGVAILLFICISTPFIPNLLISTLEDNYPVLMDFDKYQKDSVHILVLGEGHSFTPALPPTNQLNSIALGRLAEGIRIHNKLPRSKLIFSGGKKSEVYTQSHIQGRAALDLGIDSIDISYLPATKNTKDEAIQYKQNFNSQAQLILITDACHMPRAMYVFQHNNIAATPAPTNHYVKVKGYYNWWTLAPLSHNITKTERAIYEYVGKLWYQLNQ